jgi:oxygen-independent coproporphyrinogen-3 oxidase
MCAFDSTVMTFCPAIGYNKTMETALYIHFPFCIRKCLYCDFNSVAGAEIPQQAYTDALVGEMELRRETLPGGVTASTLYLGGGTPSLLEPAQVERIIAAACRLFSLEPGAEITMEANPGTVNREKLSAYRSTGVNRLSLGIQSFSDDMLALLGRVHSAQEGIASFAAAREAGFANIGIDLIHSLPGQTPEHWRAELERAILLQPEHVSAYGLTIEAGTPFHAMERSGELALPEEESSAEMFENTSELLCETGYEHYEISNFALPGFRSRHNQVYWQRGDYLGFGAGAHSFLSSPHSGRRWKNPDDPESYMLSIANGITPDEEMTVVQEREARAETLFLGLRMLEGVDGNRFRKEFAMSLEDAYPEELRALLSEGLLEWEKGRLRIAGKGLILANQVLIRFI